MLPAARLPAQVCDQREHPGQQRGQHFPVAELRSLLLSRFRRRLHTRRSGAPAAVHEGYVQVQPAHSVDQHHHLCPRAHRIARRRTGGMAADGGPRTSASPATPSTSIQRLSRTAATSDWPACGAGGMFAEYGVAPPYNQPAGWAVLSQVTFFSHNAWSGNAYHGPSTFYAWNQGNQVGWADWTGAVSKGDKCSTLGERQSGQCRGPFGQDSGSIYRSQAGSAPSPSAVVLWRLTPPAAGGPRWRRPTVRLRCGLEPEGRGGYWARPGRARPGGRRRGSRRSCPPRRARPRPGASRRAGPSPPQRGSSPTTTARRSPPPPRHWPR